MMGVSSRSVKVCKCDLCGKIREEGSDGFSGFFEIGGADTGHIYVHPAASDRSFSLFDDSETFVDSLCFCSCYCLAWFVNAAIERQLNGIRMANSHDSL